MFIVDTSEYIDLVKEKIIIIGQKQIFAYSHDQSKIANDTG